MARMPPAPNPMNTQTQIGIRFTGWRGDADDVAVAMATGDVAITGTGLGARVGAMLGWGVVEAALADMGDWLGVGLGEGDGGSAVGASLSVKVNLPDSVCPSTDKLRHSTV